MSLNLTINTTLTLIVLLLLNACGTGQKSDISAKEIQLKLGPPKILENKKCGAYRIRFINNKTIVTSGSRTLCIWDVEKGKRLKTFNIKASGLAVSPNGKYLGLGLKNKAVIFDIEKGKIIKTFPGHRDWVESCAFHPNGNYFVIGNNSKLHLLEIKSGKNISTIVAPNRLNGLQFSLDGKALISGTVGSGDNYITLFDFNNKKLKYNIPIPGPSSSISTYEKNDILLAASTMTYKNKKPWPPYIAEVQVWDVLNKTQKIVFSVFDKNGKIEYINTASFHTAGKIIATGSIHGTVNIHNIKNGKSIYKYKIKFSKSHSSIVFSTAFSFDGKYLLAGTSSNILIWEIP